MLNRKYSKKNGYVSIEFVFGLSILLLVMLIMIGMFAYVYPRQYLEKEVSNLAQQAKINGGLTQENIEEFRDNIKELGMSATISAYTDTKTAINVAPRGTSYNACVSNFNPFITRKSGEIITIEVVIEASDDLVKGPLAFFGGATLPEKYTLVNTVMSERNKC